MNAAPRGPSTSVMLEYLKSISKASGSFSIERLTLFHVYEEDDREEGRAGRTLRYIVRRREAAEVLAVGLGVQSHPGPIEPVDYAVLTLGDDRRAILPFSAFGKTEALERQIAEGETRAGALCKLTPEERRALGLR